MFPDAESKAIDAPYRADGLWTGDFWAQSLPSQTQVSAKRPLLPSPPNKTTFREAESKAIALPCRADGLWTGDFCDQDLTGGTLAAPAKPCEPTNRKQPTNTTNAARKRTLESSPEMPHRDTLLSAEETCEKLTELSGFSGSGTAAAS
ncbi:MAG: hypothetical protein M9938_01160 [Solirubrobacterales bacterium]|nr:hypothetical protein [Solirubrobacterales bacterium]